MSTEPNTITDKQQNFINNLLTQREVPEHVSRSIVSVGAVANLSKQAASEIISALLDSPEKTGVKFTREAGNADDNYGIPSADALPTGRYAIYDAADDLTFYRVWRGTRNPDYVKVYLQHGPDETEIPFGKGLVTIAKLIAQEPAEAAIRYGHEIGACSVCAKRLTNRVSRALGIGPVCGGHFYGEEFKVVVKGAREQIKAQGLDPDENVEENEDVVRYDINAEDVRGHVAEVEEAQQAQYNGPAPEFDRFPNLRDAEGLIKMSILLGDLEKRSDAELEGIAAYAKALLDRRLVDQVTKATEEVEQDTSFLGR